MVTNNFSGDDPEQVGRTLLRPEPERCDRDDESDEEEGRRHEKGLMEQRGGRGGLKEDEEFNNQVQHALQSGHAS
jgi:hypothetical protein